MTDWHKIVTPLIGRPFEWGALGPDTFDCWGLVKHVLAKTGIEINFAHAVEQGAKYAEIQDGINDYLADAPQWQHVGGLREALPGDVLLLGKTKHLHHIGIMTPYGVLHSSSPLGVSIMEVQEVPVHSWRHVEAYRWAG